MDGATHTHDCRVGIAKAAIPEGIQLSNRSVPDDEFSFCHSNARSFQRGEIIAGAGVLVDMFARVQRGFVSASTMLPDGREFIVEIIPQSGAHRRSRGPAPADVEPRISSQFRLRTAFFRRPLVARTICQRSLFPGESCLQGIGACCGARAADHFKRRVVLAIQAGQHAFAALHGLWERYSE